MSNLFFGTTTYMEGFNRLIIFEMHYVYFSPLSFSYTESVHLANGR